MVRRSRAEWMEVLATFENSGESIAKFCTKRQIAPRTLAWWRWHLRDERRASPARENVRLIAVDVAPPIVEPPTAEATLRITLADVELHFAVGTNIGYVGALVSALRSRC